MEVDENVEESVPLPSNELEKHETDESDDDLQKPKQYDDDDEGNLCSVCFEPWTNSGAHRLCSLKCGHLFGHSCAMKWFSLHPKKTCPTCKAKVLKGDVRFIYAKKLIAVDTTELDQLKWENQKLKEERNQLKMELTKSACKIQLLQEQVDKLSNLEKLVIKENTSNENENSSKQLTFTLVKTYDVCNQAGCRVLDCSPFDNVLAVSMKSPNPLFSGYGVKKINITGRGNTEFVPLHSKPIRDLAFNPINGWLLSSSLDKTAKILDPISNSLICTLQGSNPLWSCHWIKKSASECVLLGEQQGSVAVFDTRRPGEPLTTLEVPGDMSPVVALSSMAPSSIAPHGAALVCKLNSCWAFEDTVTAEPTETNWRRSQLFPLDGPFTAMTYKNEQLLASTRPGARHSYSRHIVGTMAKSDDGASSLACQVVHTFQGSSQQKMLSRSQQFLFPADNDSLIAAHHEGLRGVAVWSVRSGARVGLWPSADIAIDLCALRVAAGQQVALAALTERQLSIATVHY